MGVNLDIEPHIKVIEGGIQLRIMTEENGSNGTILFEKVTLNSLLFSGEEWNLLTLLLYRMSHDRWVQVSSYSLQVIVFFDNFNSA